MAPFRFDSEQQRLWNALGEWMYLADRRHTISIHRHYVRDLYLCKTLYAQN